MKVKAMVCAAITAISMHFNMTAQDKTDNQELIFPAENIASSDCNTGEVHLSILKDGGNTMITNFYFSPGSRNFWHYHPNAEQTLLVLDGEGFYQEEGEEKRVIKKGDVIVSKVNVRHWNGAAPDKPLICMTVTEHSVDGHVVQLRPVTDEEYGTNIKTNNNMARKIIQTAGRKQLGEFAPEFAHLNDDILFGEVWSRNDLLSLRDRSLVTITSLISQGITDNSLTYHLQEAKKNGITRTEAAEIITHIAFYAGWPKAWATFNLAKNVWKEDESEASGK